MEQVNMLRWRNATDAALRGFDEILSIRRRLDGPRSLPVADVLTDIAATRLRRFEWAKIARLTREAVAIQDVHGSAPTEGHALSLNMLGLALRQLGRLDEADAVLHRAVAVQEARRKASPAIEPHRSHMHRLAAWADLAGVQLLHGDSLAAWESQERALSRTWLERSWARGDIDSTRCWDHMLERVQARLSDSTAMIGWVDPIYVPGHSRSPFWGYVIRRTGPVRWIEMQSTARDPLHAFGYAADEMRWRLVMVSRWPFRIRTWDEIKRLQRDLWDLRVASLEPFLDGVRELVVVSPSIDYLCPLELMRDDHGRILGDRFAITYEPSALHYIAAPDPARESRTRGRWSGILIQPRGLAATDREVARLARHLRDPRVLSGETATEAAVRRLEAHGTLREADLLHFASHGYATSRIEPIMLELSGADSSGTHPSWNDGFLTLDELERWELHTRLLTLSACGFGFQEYSQGAFGFGRSLSDAGARSVVMSILPVEDEAASLYMRYFYDALFEPCAPPRSIAESMRVARMRLRGYRDPAGGQPFAHPMYWSAFVLLGDPG